MAIKCTVTTDLQAKDTNGYSGIQKHVEHDENINHANQDIVFSETQFNQYDKSRKHEQQSTNGTMNISKTMLRNTININVKRDTQNGNTAVLKTTSNGKRRRPLY